MSANKKRPMVDWSPSEYELRNERVIKVVEPTVSRASMELLVTHSFDELIRPRDAHGLAPLVEAAKAIAPAIQAEKYSLQVLSILAKQADFEELLSRFKEIDASLNENLLKKKDTNQNYHVHVRLGRYTLGSVLRQEYESTEAARLEQ